MTDEGFVRAHCGDSVLDPSSEGEHIFFHVGDCAGWNFASWTTAAEYVRERLERIEETVEEIAILKSISLSPSNISAVRRCIKRAESALADLKRGMK